MKLDDDDFALFGLPRRFAIDRADLDRRWRELQSEVHPDRFAAQGAAAQRVAMQWSVRINEAYARLEDAVRRGGYLCELAGVPIDAQRNTSMPQAFLLQQLEWREALDEACAASDLAPLEDQVARAERSLLEALETNLDQRGNTQEAAAQVRCLMFVRRFRDDIERRLEAFESP